MPTLPPAAESSPKTCRNCDAPLHGPYCSACGQHDVDYHRSFRHVCEDLLEGMFHFEGKFFVSVAWLIGWPGRLTKEFIAGRRQRQLNPLRFYLFVSVLFFLQRSLQSDGHLVGGHAEIDLNGEPVTARPDPAEPAKDGSPGEAGRERGNADDASSPALAGVLTEHRKPHEAPKKPARPAASAAGPAKPSDAERPIIEFSPAPGLAQTLEHKLSSRELTWSDVLTEIEHRIPTVFFLGVPLFALLLKLLYLGSGRLYLEHLIFSLHLHTWAFLALLVGGGYLQLAAFGSSWLGTLFGWALTGWGCWYVLNALHSVYSQRWRTTVLKAGVLAIGHACILLLLAVTLAGLVLVWFALK